MDIANKRALSATRAVSGRRTVAYPRCHVDFILLSEFSTFCLSAIADVLASANRIFGNEQFSWAVRQLSGVSEGEFRVLERPNNVVGAGTKWTILVGSDRPIALEESVLRVQALRMLRHADIIGATGSGVALLSSCGLLAGKKVAVRPDYIRTFQDYLSETVFGAERLCVDGNLWTSPGGAAAIDMGIEIVRFGAGDECLVELASRLGVGDVESILHQRISVSARYGVRHEKLAKVIEFIEGLEEDTLDTATLAARVELSTRQVERLFKRYLGVSPGQFDRSIRLRRSRDLLRHTPMSIVDVAQSCGFVNSAHFSKRFKMEFGESPTNLRNRFCRAKRAA